MVSNKLNKACAAEIPHQNNIAALEKYRRQSYDGFEFDSKQTQWTLRKGVRLDLQELKNLLPEMLVEGCFETLAFYAENYSAGTTKNYSVTLRNFLRSINREMQITEFSITSLANYRGEMLFKYGHDRELISLRPILLKWHDLGYSGVSIDMIRTLKSWTLKKPLVGEAVKRLDPLDGPLDPSELSALKTAIMVAYEKNRVTHHDLTICLLCIYTGRRPCQISGLKIKDLVNAEHYKQEASPTLARGNANLIYIPRAKQTNSKFRELRKPVALIPELWTVALTQKDNVSSRFCELLRQTGWDLHSHDTTEIISSLPLFPSWRLVTKFLNLAKTLISQDRHGEAYSKLRTLVNSEAWHVSADGIQRTVKYVTQISGALDRTGNPLHVSPRRLRYTKGTDAARAGYGSIVIAELLDHSNTSCVDIYTKISAEHAGPINRAMAMAMAPLVKLFRGEVVMREEDAVGGAVPTESRILFNGIGTATCGQKAKCALSKFPRPCYTCNHFQPWLDGPHEEVLDGLLREREERRLILQDDLMIGVDDQTIFAVVNVIEKCKEMRRSTESRQYNNRLISPSNR